METTHLPALLPGQHSTSSTVPTYSVSFSLRLFSDFPLCPLLLFCHIFHACSLCITPHPPSPSLFFYCCFSDHITHFLCWSFLYGILLCFFLFYFTQGFAHFFFLFFFFYSSIGLSSHIHRHMFVLIYSE